MFLMTEHLESKLDYITEEKNGKKNVMIEGIFMQAESKNRNGRVYPKSIMENAVKKYVTEQVNKGRSVGELIILMDQLLTLIKFHIVLLTLNGMVITLWERHLY